MTFVYLTYLESISGVYEGQVIDVCNHIRHTFNVPTQLIAVLSPRDFTRQRGLLLARAPDACTIRSPLGWRAWPLARRLVRAQIAAALPSGASAVLARGPLAALFALDLKYRGLIAHVGYDGRGAVGAEWSEYDVAPSPTWKARIVEIERETVLASDMRVAVSKQLVMHWRETFGYAGDRHVVIPCTLSTHHAALPPDADEIARRRTELGLSADQTVICYAGSVAEWQSIGRLETWLDVLLAREPHIALLLLTRADLSGTRLVTKHGGRIRQTWVAPDQVRRTMETADFGLLVRERSVTNRVAAPTKFAEYLAAGLRVLISSDVGDYSQIVQDHDLGVVCALTDTRVRLDPPTPTERRRLAAFAIEHFSKASHTDSYIAALEGLGFPAGSTATTPILLSDALFQ